MCTAPSRAPASYSSGSRTSSTAAPSAISRRRPAGSTRGSPPWRRRADHGTWPCAKPYRLVGIRRVASTAVPPTTAPDAGIGTVDVREVLVRPTSAGCGDSSTTGDADRSRESMTEQDQFVDVGVVAVDHVVDLPLVGGVDETLLGERAATGRHRVHTGSLGRGPVGRQGERDRSRRGDSGAAATTAGSSSEIGPRSTTSGDGVHLGRPAVDDRHPGSGRGGHRHATGGRIDAERRADGEQHVARPADRHRPVDHLGHERLPERDRVALEDARRTRDSGGSSSPPRTRRSVSAIGRRSPHDPAARPPSGAVDLDHQRRVVAGALVQLVDVLGHDAAQLARSLELDDGVVPGIGLRPTTAASRRGILHAVRRTSGSAR